VWKAELLGALGGLLTALAALQKLRGYRNPYNRRSPRPSSGVLAGALTGLLGVAILHSGAFQLDPVEANSLLAFAILFGAAQELLSPHQPKSQRNRRSRDSGASS
jgi:hypothetical protein